MKNFQSQLLCVQLIGLLLLPIAAVAESNVSTTIEISVSLESEVETEPLPSSCLASAPPAVADCESDLIQVESIETNGQQIVMVAPIYGTSRGNDSVMTGYWPPESKWIRV